MLKLRMYWFHLCCYTLATKIILVTLMRGNYKIGNLDWTGVYYGFAHELKKDLEIIIAMPQKTYCANAHKPTADTFAVWPWVAWVLFN